MPANTLNGRLEQLMNLFFSISKCLHFAGRQSGGRFFNLPIAPSQSKYTVTLPNRLGYNVAFSVSTKCAAMRSSSSPGMHLRRQKTQQRSLPTSLAQTCTQKRRLSSIGLYAGPACTNRLQPPCIPLLESALKSRLYLLGI
jgi:hypothetical protein